MKLTHSKKSNLGLIFEYLIQELVESMVTENVDKKKNISKIIKKYFFLPNPLREEFNIFSTILNSEYAEKADAQRFIIECLEEISKLRLTLEDRKKLKKQLLDEIYKVCDKSTFFNHSINNYSIYASTNLLIDYYSKNKKINEIQHIVHLEKILVEHVSNNKIKKENKNFLKQLNETSTVENTEMLTTIYKYKEKLYDNLNEQQQELLNIYMVSPNTDIVEQSIEKYYRTNYNKLRNLFLKESIDFTKNKLKETLNTFQTSFKNSSSIEERLKVVLDSFNIVSEKENVKKN